MKRILLILLLAVLLPMISYAATAGDLLVQLRERVSEMDESTSYFADTTGIEWLNQAQSKIVRIGGHIPKYVDVTYIADSSVYPLPSGFRSLDGGAMVKESGRDYVNMFLNPLFMIDTLIFQFFVKWEDENQAHVYVKGRNLSVGDKVRVFYFGTAPALTASADSCYVPQDLHVYIIEEAISFYYGSSKREDIKQAIWQATRTDMGLIKQTEIK